MTHSGAGRQLIIDSGWRLNLACHTFGYVQPSILELHTIAYTIQEGTF